MKKYSEMTKEELRDELSKSESEYKNFKSRGLKLNMARGNPGPEQLKLSLDLLTLPNAETGFLSSSGADCRNYGVPEGIPEWREIAAELLGVSPDDVIAGGNSSLNMMFDAVSCFMTHGAEGYEPWIKQGKIKLLCPSPGYDRHFNICKYYGIEMIPVKMTDTGPDMDEVEELARGDESVKGMWCVPKYSNPTGVTYSDETVERLARLSPKAGDFRIFWDNAYCVHDLTDDPDELKNFARECSESGSSDIPVMFCSTSKMTFPGAGVAAMACFGSNKKILKERYSSQIISYDKLNQLRHALFFGNAGGVRRHMQKHRAIIGPKFGIVTDILECELAESGLIEYTKPKGGYFVSVNVPEGCAKRVVELCRDAGVVLTGAGATYPYGKDPRDSNIRLAPTYPSIEELKLALNLFCLCVKLAYIEKKLSKI